MIPVRGGQATERRVHQTEVVQGTRLFEPVAGGCPMLRGAALTPQRQTKSAERVLRVAEVHERAIFDIIPDLARQATRGAVAPGALSQIAQRPVQLALIGQALRSFLPVPERLAQAARPRDVRERLRMAVRVPQRHAEIVEYLCPDPIIVNLAVPGLASRGLKIQALFMH